MNTKKIKSLIDVLNESNLESLAYKDQEFEIELKKPSVTQKIVEEVTVSRQSEEIINKNYIKSILVGVFYSKPSPDSNAYVSVGDKVNAGDVICIIESMKIMNEIKADKSGVIEEVLVNDGDTVDFDQPLFTIK